MESISQSSHKGPQILSSHGALAPGADLWIIPNLTDSQWCSRLDWYLNFQISRAALHKSQQPNPRLEEMMEELDLEPPRIEKQDDNPLLMIACANRLPAEMVIHVPNGKSYDDWVVDIHKVWKQLLRPSMRVFLPKGFPVSQFGQNWPNKQTLSAISLVPNQSTEIQ